MMMVSGGGAVLGMCLVTGGWKLVQGEHFDHTETDGWLSLVHLPAELIEQT